MRNSEMNPMDLKKKQVRYQLLLTAAAFSLSILLLFVAA